MRRPNGDLLNSDRVDTQVGGKSVRFGFNLTGARDGPWLPADVTDTTKISGTWWEVQKIQGTRHGRAAT